MHIVGQWSWEGSKFKLIPSTNEKITLMETSVYEQQLSERRQKDLRTTLWYEVREKKLLYLIWQSIGRYGNEIEVDPRYAQMTVEQLEWKITKAKKVLDDQKSVLEQVCEWVLSVLS